VAIRATLCGVASTARASGCGPPRPLTPREIEVLALAAEGLSGPDLAETLALGPATVNTHFTNMHT
jgi:DNA-binding NarL/FixJ family response regulator